MAREQQKSSYKRSHFMCCCPESFHPHVKHEKCRVTRFQIEIVVRGILQLNTLTGCAGHRLRITSTARPPTAPTGRRRCRRRQKPRGVIRSWFYSGIQTSGPFSKRSLMTTGGTLRSRRLVQGTSLSNCFRESEAPWKLPPFVSCESVVTPCNP